MRVLVVHNRYRSAQPSGENAVVEEEVRLLRERGLDVHQLTAESDRIATWPAPKRMLLPARVVWSREGRRATARRISDVRPDVVHFHNTFPLLSPSALWAAHRSGASVVKTLHNFRPLCPAGVLFRDGHVCEECVGRAPLPAVRHGCYRDSRAATLPLALLDGLHARAGTWRTTVDRYITPSEFARSRYLAAGWPAEQLVVKYNTAERQPSIRRGAGRGFVCLARLGPEKGVDVLIRAWGEAFPDGGEGLEIIGSGDLEARLREQAAQVHGVRLAGQLTRDQALDRMRSARAVVMPSVWYEVFPRTVVEAYSLAVPVIASRLGSLAEVVEDQKTGLLFEAGSSTALARVLTTLAASDRLGEQLGRGGLEAYERLFSPAVTTDRLLEIYRSAGAPNGALERAPAKALPR